METVTTENHIVLFLIFKKKVETSDHISSQMEEKF